MEISLLFQQNIEYRFVFTLSLSISNPGYVLSFSRKTQKTNL